MAKLCAFRCELCVKVFPGACIRHSIRGPLAIFKPAHDLGQVGFLAVHQDADAIDARRNPENGSKFEEDEKIGRT